MTSTVIRLILKMLASAGISTVVNNAVKATTPLGTKLYMRILIAIGSFVIGSMICDKGEEYVDKTMDEAKEVVEGIKDGIADIKFSFGK